MQKKNNNFQKHLLIYKIMTETQKPKIKLTGKDSNIFILVGIASKALKSANQKDKSEEMKNRVFASNNYNEALSIIMEYCDVS